MPNWCSNTVTFKGNPQKIKEFVDFLEEKDGKNWFDFFVEPAEEGNEDWYQHNLDTYGCKWNCDAQDWSVDEDFTGVSFWFDSPWSPPTTLYETIYNEDNGIDVEAEYNEEGMGFVGRFEDGSDEYYEYDYDNLSSLDDIPEDLLENWNIREQVEHYLEENEEDNQ